MTEYDKFLELIETEDIKQRIERRKKNDEKLEGIRKSKNLVNNLSFYEGLLNKGIIDKEYYDKIMMIVTNDKSLMILTNDNN